MGEIMTWLRQLLHQITAYYALNGFAFFVELLVVCFLACAVCCLQFYAAMAIGHSFANHKVAFSVLFFFVMQFVEQLVVSFVAAFSNWFDWDWFQINIQGMAAIHAMMGLLSAGLLVYGAVFYIITAIMLKKHLNLE